MNGRDSGNEAGVSFFDELGAELSRAARCDVARRPQRRRRIVRVSAAVALIVVIVVGFEVVRSPSAVAGIEIEHAGPYLMVRLVDVEGDPGGVEQALRGAGLNATVAAIPAAPSKVGRFVQLGQRSTNGTGLEWVDLSDGAAAGFRIPDSYGGELELVIGRPARPWEHYAAPASAYAPGEPLYCSNLWGQRVADALDTLDQLGVRVRWNLATAAGVTPVADPATIANMFITDAISTSRTEVLITVGPTGKSPYRTPAPPPCK